MLPSGNHEYQIGSTTTVNGDKPNVLSVFSKVESNLM